MSEHDLEKLLGGFAADTLTAEERKLLYTAALHDQQLFNTLADEQALKELLADPAVRRRLLQALNQTSTSGAGGSLAWLDWFRRPASLAFAGGLAVVVFAVVLGTKVYQDSLRQAAQSVATEDNPVEAPPSSIAPASEPALPKVTAPELKAKTTADPTVAPAKKESFADKRSKGERPLQPTTQEQRASDRSRDNVTRRRDDGALRAPAEAPVAAIGGTAADAIAPIAQSPAGSTAPPPTSSTPAPMHAPARAPTVKSVPVKESARALYYGTAPAPINGGLMAKEQVEAMTPSTESVQESNRLARQLEARSRLGEVVGKAAEAVTPLKPLGLRYSFVVRETNRQDREVDAVTAAKSIAPVSLTIETNQDGYLQVWTASGTSTPQLLLPQKETGQISLKIAAGQRQTISLPRDSGTLTLTARFSRVPFGPITRQEAAMFDRISPSQLEESVTAVGPDNSQEQATYVVSRDPAQTAQLVTAILLRR